MIKGKLLPNLNMDVVSGIKGVKLDAYLVALEGWRRGLELKWYKDETQKCSLDRANGNTQGKFFSLSSSKTTHYFFRSRGDKVSNATVELCRDKNKTKFFLQEKGVPTTTGKVFNIEKETEMINYAKHVGYPVIIKPLKGSMGRGVYINIENENQLIKTIKNAKETYKYNEYLLEKHYYGKEYRIYVVGNEVVGATHRVPANITGDGVQSIKDLIDEKNRIRSDNPYLAAKPIKIDYEVKRNLSNLSYDLNSIPRKGELIYLRGNSNLSSGGDPIEATEELSKDVKKIAVDALKALPSIPHAGVDIIVDPDSHDTGVVLEVNATAEISFHAYPYIGEPKNIPKAIIDYYFPETIDAAKSSYYFDYQSILAPLKTWATNEIKVADAPFGKMFGKKYIVKGDLHKVGYLNWIRRKALNQNLLGYAKKISKNEIEVLVTNENEDKVNGFINYLKKGPKKAKIIDVAEEKLAIVPPLNIGFDIYT